MPTIDPWRVRFTQDSIKPTFRDGRPIEELADGLKSGTVQPDEVEPIRLVELDGELYSLDNRRLEAFRRAGVPIPYRMATVAEVKHESRKFTTTNNGASVRMRDL